ncbi:immunoglobulin V-set domain protein [Ancylostoma duodenale]|uniref:Immunoglobulin V-set domain protein n=1 Tax=Ancylostoma duodenale TaxID=51022 RepID=A0A0C2D9R0_9BILA|nr:immunoglobulin V-set domain protein [Ancylostoma duodenale]
MANAEKILCLVAFVEGEQTIVEGPQESFVFLGQTVVLRCKVSNQKGAVQWMKNGFGLGVDRQLKFFPRYSMIGSASRGEYNLQITNTTVGDDDVYACQINEAASEPSVISNPAKLTVLSTFLPPLSPKLALAVLFSLSGASRPLRRERVVLTMKQAPHELLTRCMSQGESD